MSDEPDNQLTSKQFHRFEVFHGLTAEEVEQVSECAEIYRVESGEEIMTEGARNRDLFGLMDGKIEVLKTGEDGDVTRVAELEPFAAFGELGLAVGAPRTATIRTVTPCRFLRINGETFQKLQSARSDAAYKIEHNILRILAHRLADANRELSKRGDGAYEL